MKLSQNSVQLVFKQKQKKGVKTLGFTHYYGKHKHKDKHVAQTCVAQNKSNVLRARMNDELYHKIKQKCRETGKGEGELTRMLWQNYFDKAANLAWKEEVKNWG